MFQNSSCRNLVQKSNLVLFEVVVKETDLFIQAAERLEKITKELILQHRWYIETYIRRYPEFVETLKPWRVNGAAPAIIRDMAKAGEMAGVGPMAAVAGAIARYVGADLLSHTDEVVVENGGDVFLKTDSPVTVGIFAGRSPLSLRIGLRIDSTVSPVSVCTSSGTVGHSKSMGIADAVSVVSESCPLADAVATSIGNLVRSKSDIQRAIDSGKRIEGIIGLVIIVGDAVGLWGELEVVPLRRFRECKKVESDLS